MKQLGGSKHGYDKTGICNRRESVISCIGCTGGGQHLSLIHISVTEQYFKEIYIDKNTKKPIELSNKVKHNLKSKANKLISLYSRKGIKLMFTDVDKILQTLKII